MVEDRLRRPSLLQHPFSQQQRGERELTVYHKKINLVGSGAATEKQTLRTVKYSFSVETVDNISIRREEELKWKSIRRISNDRDHGCMRVCFFVFHRTAQEADRSPSSAYLFIYKEPLSPTTPRREVSLATTPRSQPHRLTSSCLYTKRTRTRCFFLSSIRFFSPIYKQREHHPLLAAFRPEGNHTHHHHEEGYYQQLDDDRV